MEKTKMKRFLDHIDESTMPHIFCPSYMRPKFVSGKLFRTFSPAIQREKIHIVVRPEQYEAYREANPEFDIISLGDYPVNGLASTRQFIFEYAVEHKYPIIIDMDDDIKVLTYLFNGVTAKGDPCSKHSLVSDAQEDPLLQQKVLLGASCIARQVFKKYPTVVLGNIRRQRMCQDENNARLKYIIDCGPTPRQVTLMNVKSLYKMGINRDTKKFDRHGDDIGFVAKILAQGGHCFNIPCLTYDYISEKCDSVIRTPETEKELHAYEYRMLQKYPIKEYLRMTFKDEEGNYMWGDVNWQAYHKITNTKSIKVYWKGDKR